MTHRFLNPRKKEENMRFKGYSLFVVFLVLFTTLIFCTPKGEKPEVDVDQIWADYGNRMFLSEDMEKQREKYEAPTAKCIPQINERNKKISALFERKEFSKMAEKLQNWIVIPSVGELIRGKDNIEKFWSHYYQQASAKGDVELAFKILYTYFNDDIKYRELTIDGELIDFTVYIHLQYKVIVREKGEIVQNDSGTMSGEGKHKMGCPVKF
jgi:hypothetical protein